MNWHPTIDFFHAISYHSLNFAVPSQPMNKETFVSKNFLQTLQELGVITIDDPLTKSLLAGISMSTSLAECEKMGAIFYGVEQISKEASLGKICIGVEVYAVLPFEISEGEEILLPVVGFSIRGDGMTLARNTPTGLGCFPASAIKQYFFILNAPPSIENYQDVRPRVECYKKLSDDDLRKIGYAV